MIRIPPYLKPGDTIGIVCPAGFMTAEKAATCIQVLQDWGYKVKVGTTVGSKSANYFSGTDDERLLDLQSMLDDENVHAILCGRGGYGTSRIIDKLDFKRFKKKPKWIIGFSDITVLHAHLNRRLKVASLHAPMAAAFNDEGYQNEYIQSLKSCLTGTRATYTTVPHIFNRNGSAIGELVGGNLAIIVHLIATPSALKTKGKILFLEDTGEQLYSIDRMFIQLKRCGKLDELAGLVIGGFTDMKDTERPFGKTINEIIHEHTKDLPYPVCFGFPVSHDKENYALKSGVSYKLSVSKTKVKLTEQ
jgi:muramoyltetrapeptide carboxypeptidase